jgi:hypothetical protein
MITMKRFHRGFFGVAFLLALSSWGSEATPDAVKQLIDWETKSNAVSLRSNEELVIKHYEIPLEALTADLAPHLDPKVRDSLVFEKDGKPWVRWIINSEDTKWHLQVAKFLQERGLDSKPKTHFKGYRTASRSMIIVDPTTGAKFSAKVSTNNTGGHWVDKKQPYDDALQARTSSDMIAEIKKKVQFEHLVLMDEPAMFGIKEVDQGMLIRSLEDLPQGGRYYLPGFSALHDETGKKIAKLNGSNNPAEFWNENYNKKLARAYAEFAAHTGLTYDSPHSQNFLIELDANMKPTGRIVLRDFVDSYAQEDILKAAGKAEFLRTWDSGNIHRGSLDVAVGTMHGNDFPSWLNEEIYSSWGADFYREFDREFSRLTGIPLAELKAVSHSQSHRYFSKDYTMRSASAKKYLGLMDCFFGLTKTRAGVDCPDYLVRKVSARRAANACQNVVKGK